MFYLLYLLCSYIKYKWNCLSEFISNWKYQLLQLFALQIDDFNYSVFFNMLFDNMSSLLTLLGCFAHWIQSVCWWWRSLEDSAKLTSPWPDSSLRMLMLPFHSAWPWFLVLKQIRLDVKFDQTVTCNLSHQGELTKCYHRG